MAVWSSDDSLGGTAGRDRDIQVSRSIDGGTTWSVPTLLSPTFTADSGADESPVVVSNGVDTFIVLWSSDGSLDGTAERDGDIHFSRSTNGGVSWTAPAVLNAAFLADAGGDVDPCLVADGAGAIIAVWSSDDSLGGTSGRDRDIHFSRSTNGGVSWTAPAVLNAAFLGDAGEDEDPALAVDAAGTLAAVWTTDESLGGTVGRDRDIHVSRSTDGGVTWAPPSTLNPAFAGDSGEDEAPALAAIGAGTFVGVWSSDDSLGGTAGRDRDILVSSSADGGVTWTAPSLLSSALATDSGEDERPALATDGEGNLIAVWSSDDSLGGTAERDRDIVLSRSTNGGATWAAPSVLSTAFNGDSGEDDEASIGSSGGSWLVLWSSNGSFGASEDGDAHAIASRSPSGTIWGDPMSLDSVPPAPVPIGDPWILGALAVMLLASALTAARRANP